MCVLLKGEGIAGLIWEWHTDATRWIGIDIGISHLVILPLLAVGSQSVPSVCPGLKWTTAGKLQR